MKSIALYEMTDGYVRALDDLRDSDFDEQTIADTLEGLAGELTQKAQNVAAYSLNLDAEIDAMKSAEKRIADRRKRLEKDRDWLRNYLLSNMLRAEITEIAANDKSFRVRVMAGSESVEVEDEAALPADYKRVKTVEEPDKVLIKQAIKDGFDVPGARLVRKPSLKID